MFAIISPFNTFNSRPHAEVDTEYTRLLMPFNLSTHDLTQRSTEKWIPCGERLPAFNSRPHAEVDNGGEMAERAS